jgi:hypothetical protein
VVILLLRALGGLTRGKVVSDFGDSSAFGYQARHGPSLAHGFFWLALERQAPELDPGGGLHVLELPRDRRALCFG